VTVTLASDREAELRLSYQVRGTGWQPTYRATVFDTARERGKLLRYLLRCDVLFFGGGSISDFALVLFIGVTVGTFSSIYIATPVALLWHKAEKV